MTMKRTSRACVNHPDNFFYICEDFTTKEQGNNLAERLKAAYQSYFAIKLGDQAFGRMGYRISLKMHFVYSRLDFSMMQ